MKPPPLLRALAADERGATAVLLALTLAMLLGFLTLGLDSTTGLLARQRLQADVDEAALAGALALRAAAHPAPAVYLVAGVHDPAVSWPPASGVHARDGAAVEVAARAGRPAMLGLLGGGDAIAVRAVARLEPGPAACLLALAPAGGIGPAGFFRLEGCIALSAADGLGGLRLAEADPWRDRPPVPAGPCAASALVVGGPQTIAAGGRPFIFCGGLTVAPGGRLRLEPGTYVVSGPLTVAPGGAVEGAGVTLILAEGAGATVFPAGRLALAAPATGPMAGLALAADGVGPAVRLEGGSEIALAGAAHLPGRTLALAMTGPSACTQFIAWQIVASGAVRLSGSCDGIAPPIRDRVARLVE